MLLFLCGLYNTEMRAFFLLPGLRFLVFCLDDFILLVP